MKTIQSGQWDYFQTFVTFRPYKPTASHHTKKTMNLTIISKDEGERDTVLPRNPEKKKKNPDLKLPN